MPIRSESDAFRFTAGTAAVVGLSVLAGWLLEPWVGVAVAAVAAAAAGAAYVRVGGRDRRAVLREAAGEPHPHGAATGRRHVLVIANDALSGAELRERILGGTTAPVEVDVLAPVLTSRMHYGMSDVDREIADARSRLEPSLAWAREQGFAVRGEVGDPDPVAAIADELRDFGADEVIVVTHASDGGPRQEQSELERLRRELDVPVTEIVVAAERTLTP